MATYGHQGGYAFNEDQRGGHSEEVAVDLNLNEAPRFHYQIICDGHFRATVPNGIALDRMVRDALRRGWAVKIELREEPAPRHGR